MRNGASSIRLSWWRHRRVKMLVMVSVVLLVVPNLVCLVVQGPSTTLPSSTVASIASLFAVTNKTDNPVYHLRMTETSLSVGAQESKQNRIRSDNETIGGFDESFRIEERADPIEGSDTKEWTSSGQPMETTDRRTNTTDNSTIGDGVNGTLENEGEPPELFAPDTLLPKPGHEARDANGNFGYVADPQAMRKGVVESIEREGFWQTLNEYGAAHRGGDVLYHDVDLSDRSVCGVGPGRSFEGDGGFKLLTEKMQMDNSTEHRRSQSRIFCGIYSYGKRRNAARTQALLWGHKCDGFIVFSTETIPELGMVDLVRFGKEEYATMWRKVRTIWHYIHLHYREDYDYFHLCGDDVYVMVPNLRRFLVEQEERAAAATATAVVVTGEDEVTKLQQQQARFWGQEVLFRNNEKVVTGGPGYTLNRASLDLLASKILTSCRVFGGGAVEDRFIARCFAKFGVPVSNTWEVETAESRYHLTNPDAMYHLRPSEYNGYTDLELLSKYWATLPHPKNASQATGPRYGMETASRYSVAMHSADHPTYLARVHVLLHPATCPTESVLGRALRQRLNL